MVLLAFGFSSDVKDLIDQERKPIIVSSIFVMSFLALGLKLFYYLVMHVWSNVIWSGKKLVRREFHTEEGSGDKAAPGDNINQTFFKYVFVSRNTW